MASLLVTPLASRRKLVLDDVWESIPSSKPYLDWLVSNYYARADWGWHREFGLAPCRDPC